MRLGTDAKRPNQWVLRVLTLVVAMLCAVCLAPGARAFADDLLNTDQIGSLSVNLKCDGDPVANARLDLYKVAGLEWDKAEGQWAYVTAKGFSDLGVNPYAVDSWNEDVVSSVAEEAQDAKPIARDSSDASGRVTFGNLSTGVYLVKQRAVTVGEDTINPFMVSIPLAEDGVYVYDVNASPKVSVEKADEVTTPAVEGGTYSKTGVDLLPLYLIVLSCILAALKLAHYAFSGRRE